MKLLQFFGYFIFAIFIGGIVYTFVKLIISYFANYLKELHQHEEVHQHSKLSHN